MCGWFDRVTNSIVGLIKLLNIVALIEQEIYGWSNRDVISIILF